MIENIYYAYHNLAERFRFCFQFEIMRGNLTSFSRFPLLFPLLCTTKPNLKAATTAGITGPEARETRLRSARGHFGITHNIGTTEISEANTPARNDFLPWSDDKLKPSFPHKR